MSQGLSSRTILMDPASSSAERTFFRIQPGVKFYANKVRLLNFSILNNNSQPIYFGPRGIYQLVKKISILSVAGTEIDRIQQMDLLAIKMLHLSNSAQYSMARETMQNMCVSVTAPSNSQIELTEEQGKADATKIQAYIDITFALGFLRSCYILDSGYTIQIEWETDPLVSGIAGGYTFDTYPCLAIDECLTGEPADAVSEVSYMSSVADRLYIPHVTDGETNQLQVRLNAFFNQYIGNLYWYMDYNPRTNKEANPYHLAFSAPQEQMELVLDGRKIQVWKGVDSQARKLQQLNDLSAEVCLPGVATAYWGVGETMPTTAAGAQWGLVNPNTNVTMNGVMSYGCIKVEQFVQIDLAVYYSYLSTGGTENIYLNFFADVLRSYNKETDMVSFVQQRPNVVNTQ
jgi:hypothetical protein